MNFLDEDQSGGAAIVYLKQEAKYAHLMAQLISAYANYEVAEWEEKDWLHNKASASSSQHVIFLGNAGKDYRLGIRWMFDEFGMRYGWLGKKCVCEVKPLQSKEAKAFYTHYEERARKYELATETLKSNPLPTPVKSWLLGGIPLATASYALDRAQLSERQYQLLVYEFVFQGGMKKFMEAC